MVSEIHWMHLTNTVIRLSKRFRHGALRYRSVYTLKNVTFVVVILTLISYLNAHTLC